MDKHTSEHDEATWDVVSNEIVLNDALRALWKIYRLAERTREDAANATAEEPGDMTLFAEMIGDLAIEHGRALDQHFKLGYGRFDEEVKASEGVSDG
jgi:hypothetical protein